MSLSIFEDDDLVSALGYSHTLDRGTHGMRWARRNGRSKKLEGREVLVIIESRCSLSRLARAYGVTRAAIAYYRRAVKVGGPSAIECVRHAMRDEQQMRLPGVV